MVCMGKLEIQFGQLHASSVGMNNEDGHWPRSSFFTKSVFMSTVDKNKSLVCSGGDGGPRV